MRVRNTMKKWALPPLSRRRALELSGLGFGSLALNYLLGQEGLLGADSGSGTQVFRDLKPRSGHFEPKARAVIQLMQSGGPSQMDLFDPKPELTKWSGQPHPTGVETFQRNNSDRLFASPFTFKRYGQSGLDFSDVIPQIAGVADELCIVRSMYTTNNNHPEGVMMLQSCSTFAGRPVMGAWITYALGTENENLPAYIVLRDPKGYSSSGKVVWTSGFLSALFQGVEFSSAGQPVHHLSPTLPLPPGAQQADLGMLGKLNSLHARSHPREREYEARIQNYELAARMQITAGDVLDLSKETETTKKLYGLDNTVTAGFGVRCLMARRLVEAGVRFVQVFPPLEPDFNPWDHHSSLESGMRTICNGTDQPFAALIRDLKERGLLDTTIVLWTGEFGRLPTTQPNASAGNGRDHNRHAFSLVLAGGGFKKGFAYGETDEFGYKAVVNRVSVPDLHATILHSLGLDHARLVYPHHGIQETPTDTRINQPRVITDLMEGSAPA